MTTRRQLDEILAACDNITRLATKAPHNVIVRRFNDWTDDHIRATNYDPAPTPRRATINGVPVTLPSINDPTGEQATNRPDLNYRETVTRLLPALLAFEQALSHAARPETASKEEASGTDRNTDEHHRIGAGDCEACGRHMIGGPNPKNRLKPLYGHALCPTHNRGAHRDITKGVPVERYISSTRARLGLT